MKSENINFSDSCNITLQSLSSIRRLTELLTMSLVVASFIFWAYPIFTNSLTADVNAQVNYGLKTFETRDLVIDLENGLTTEAQLTIPLIGKGPFPGVLLIHGSGVADKDYYVNDEIAPFKQISQYLSERGFAVLKYDKRGVGPNFTVANANVWGNLTFDDLKNDAQKALDVLMNQPEVDPNRISIIGHSEGTIITPRIAIDNPSKVKNIILMGAAANNTRDLVYFREVTLPLLYADRILDSNKTGVISISEAIKDPVFNFLTRNFTQLLNSTATNESNIQSNSQGQLYNNSGKKGYMNINAELKQKLIQQANALSTVLPGKKCVETGGCPIWLQSQFALRPNVEIIREMPHTTSILIQQGTTDIATPMQQAFMLQDALIDSKHPDHKLNTYPGLGHGFHRHSEWIPVKEGIQPYVLEDSFSWLADHSGFTNSYSSTDIFKPNSSSIEQIPNSFVTNVSSR